MNKAVKDVIERSQDQILELAAQANRPPSEGGVFATILARGLVLLSTQLEGIEERLDEIESHG